MYGIHFTYQLVPRDPADRVDHLRRTVAELAGAALSLTRGTADPSQIFALALWPTEAELSSAAPIVERLVALGGQIDRVTGAFLDTVQPSTPDMIGTHVVYTTKIGQEQPFLDWKTHEGEAQRAAPGFVKRSMARSIERPNVFYYLTYWENVEAINAFVNSAAFAESKDRTNVDAAFDHYTPIRIRELLAHGGL